MAKGDYNLKVLLIGNSYTYYNGVGQILDKLAASTGKRILVVRATQGGCSSSVLIKSNKLSYKAWVNGKRIAKGSNVTLEKILGLDYYNHSKAGKWDYIVSQNNDTVANTDNGDIKMLKFVKQHKAITSNKRFILHSTQYAGSLSKDRLEQHMKVVNKYKCSIIDSRGVYGQYYKVYSIDKDDWRKYLTILDDNKHQSARGAYLYALDIYAKLFGVTEFARNTKDSEHFIKLYNSSKKNAKEFIKDKFHKSTKGYTKADSVTKSNAIKLQYLVRKNFDKYIGNSLCAKA